MEEINQRGRAAGDSRRRRLLRLQRLPGVRGGASGDPLRPPLLLALHLQVAAPPWARRRQKRLDKAAVPRVQGRAHAGLVRAALRPWRRPAQKATAMRPGHPAPAGRAPGGRRATERAARGHGIRSVNPSTSRRRAVGRLVPSSSTARARHERDALGVRRDGLGSADMVFPWRGAAAVLLEPLPPSRVGEQEP